MTTKRKISEAQTLENYRISLVNAKSQKGIAGQLAEIGYDDETMAEGNRIFLETREAYDLSLSYKDKLSAAFSDFANSKQTLSDRYKTDRKKARIIFWNESLILLELGIDNRIPRAYIPWIVTVKKFYNSAAENQDIQAGLARLKLDTEGINAGLESIKELERYRALYIKIKGESQNATDKKNAAFDRCYNWMRNFYSAAKMALSNNPQLIEALGKEEKGGRRLRKSRILASEQRKED